MPRLTHFGALVTTLLLAFVLGIPNGHHTTDAAEPPPIMLITSHDSAPYQEVVMSFRHHLDQQRIEGPLLTYSLLTDSPRIEESLANAKQEAVRLFVTVGPPATQRILGAVGHIPVLACLAANDLELRNAPNATGVTIDFSVETQLHQLQQFLPDRKTVGVLYNPTENNARIEEARRVAQTLGLTVLAHPVKDSRALPKALAGLANKAEVLWGLTDRTVLSPQTAEPILLFSFRNRIPFAGLSSSWTKAGALYALDRDYTDLGIQCGEIAIKVLQGTRAGSIPPVPPRKMTYSVNLKTARRMKVDFTPSILEGARQVFP
ncbi:MAG: ABC transporter substrate-binding protein [Deltaproteobacteria bacterium]|nr:ABC transporter substrate-binding protein [Deltaproteobacteria bacterium]